MKRQILLGATLLFLTGLTLSTPVDDAYFADLDQFWLRYKTEITNKLATTKTIEMTDEDGNKFAFEPYRKGMYDHLAPLPVTTRYRLESELIGEGMLKTHFIHEAYKNGMSAAFTYEKLVTDYPAQANVFLPNFYGWINAIKICVETHQHANANLEALELQEFSNYLKLQELKTIIVEAEPLPDPNQ